MFSTRWDHVLSIACLLHFHSYHCEPSKSHKNHFRCPKHIPMLLLLTRADALTSAKLETWWHWPVLMTDLCSGITSVSSYRVHTAVFSPPFLLPFFRFSEGLGFCMSFAVSPHEYFTSVGTFCSSINNDILLARGQL